MASWIGKHGGQAWLQIALDRDAFETAGEQGERFVGHLVHVAGAWLRSWKLRECGELIDERAQRSHAGQDDFAAFADHGGRVGLAAIEVATDPLGGERDGRERVLDLVRDALRHFLPCQLTLGAEEFGCVFDDENGAWPAVREFKPCTGDGEMHGCGRGDGIRFQWRLRPCAGRAG